MASELTLEYEESWHAVARKMPGDFSVAIDAPGTCGGSSESFSPLDLFAESYAACVIMSMDLAARKNRFDVAGSKVKVSLAVTKRDAPRIDAVEATIVLPRQYTEEEIGILQKAAEYCPIHSALRPEVEKTLTFEVE